MHDPTPTSARLPAACVRALAALRNTGSGRAMVPAGGITRRRLTGGILGMGFVIGFGLFQGQGARAQSAPGPAPSHVALLAPLANDPVFYDSGKARGANDAAIPLSGTTTAPNGATIEARIVHASTFAQVHPWTAVATASGGTWSGAFPACQRNSARLKAEVRVAGSSAAPARTAQEIMVGHIAVLIGQSEDARMFLDTFHNPTYQSMPTFADAAAEDSAFLLTHADLVGAGIGTGAYVANGIQALKPSNGSVTRSALHLANALTRNAPGEKFLFINAAVSGTSYVNLVNDADDNSPGTRKWKESFADAISFLRTWGAEPGVIMSTWTAAPGATGDNYRLNQYPIFAGKYASGAPYTYGTPTTGLAPNYVADHGFYDLTGLNRLDKSSTQVNAAFLEPAVTKFAFHGPHRFEDHNSGAFLLTSASGYAGNYTSNVIDTTNNSLSTALGASDPRIAYAEPGGFGSIVIEGSADGATGWTTVGTASGANFRIALTGTHRYYRGTVTGGGRCVIIADAGLTQQKQDTRTSIRTMVADAALASIMLPKGPEILLYRNGTPSIDYSTKNFSAFPAAWVSWQDWPHPSDFSEDGLPARAKHTAVAVLYAFGVGPSAAANRYVPKFNRRYWDPAGAFAEFWYEAPDGSKPDITTTRRARGEAAIPATYPHRTEVAGFYINNTPARNVVIATGTTVSNTVVRVYPNPASAFVYSDAVQFCLGGASGVVVWPQDEFDDIWKNLPLAVIPGLTVVDGIAMEPMPDPTGIANTMTAPARFPTTNAALAACSPVPIRDTVNFGSNGNTGSLTLRAKMKFLDNVGGSIFGINSVNLSVIRETSGTQARKILWTLKDSAGTVLIAGGTVASGVIADGQLFNLVVSINLGGNIAKMFIDGTQVASVTLGANTGAFASSRFIEFLTQTPFANAEVEVFEQWNAYTATGDTAALGTPRKRIDAVLSGSVHVPRETPSSPVWVRGALA